MPVTLLATSLKRKGLPDVTSATELGQYLAHGIFMAGEFMAYSRWVGSTGNLASVNDLIIFQQDSCLYRTNCTFVPPLNVLVTLKVVSSDWNVIFPTSPTIYTLQFNRAEVVQESLDITASFGGTHVSTWPAQAWIKMYVDETVPGLTPKSDRLEGNQQHSLFVNHNVHQYLKMSGAFDSDRPFWKDRNTKMDEFLESQRERKHICTVTNEESVNFTWNNDLTTTFNPSQSSDLLPDQSNGWTVFREWKLLDGEDLIVDENGVQDLEIQEAGIYELHFNVFFYASLFNYAEDLGNNHFATRGALNVAVSEYLHSNPTNRSVAAAHYGPIEDWVFSSNINTLDGLFEDYTLLSDYALTQISLKWDVSNITVFTDMFKGDKKYGISAVLAINDAWSTSNWSQTTAKLKTAPFETRAQLMTAISGYPTSAAVYGTIDTWEFEPALTSFEGIFSNQDISTWPYYSTSAINNWDVQYVTNMKSMFEGANGLNQHDITGWDVSNVTDMSSMFKDCVNFDQNISSWDVSNVTDMSSMFEDCTDIPDGLRNNIQNWQTSTDSTVGNVQDFTHMFKNSGKWPVDTVVEINSAWGTANSTHWSQTTAQLLIDVFETRDQVIEAINVWIFSSSVATDVYGSITAWEFKSTLTDFSGLFDRTAGLATFNEDISGWDTSNVTNMSSMFKGCSSFNQDIESVGNAWNVSSVTDMSSMFEGCSAFNGYIAEWDTSSVINMSSMFEGCSNFDRSIPDWDVSSVTDMSFMFKNCSTNLIASPNYSNWNVSSVEDMTSMFENCNSHLGSTNMNALAAWDVSSVGVTAVNNTELWSVDYVFQIVSGYLQNGIEAPVSGDDDGSSWEGPNGYSDLIYKTFTDQDGLWNKIVLNPVASAYGSGTATDKYTLDEVESCLKDGSEIYKAKSNVTHIANTQEVAHQTYSPRQSGYDKEFAGFDVLSTRVADGSPTISFEFRNLPSGTYDLRLYGQPHTDPNTEITQIYNHATFGVTGAVGTIYDQATSSTHGYVTFSNLVLAGSTLGFTMGPKAGQTYGHSVGGAQLKRTYQVSKFKDMFKGSSWTETPYGTVVDNIDSQWKSKNANWWKNEAKLSKS